jgi:hypothetical protein
MKNLFLFSVILSLVACNNAERKFKKNFEAMFFSDTTLIRKINLGDSYEAVLKAEPHENLITQDENMIKTLYRFNENEEYQFSFFFTDNRLVDVRAEVYLPETTDGKLFNEWITEMLTKKYEFLGESHGTKRWKKNKTSVELNDETELEAARKATIWYFETPASEERNF